MLTDRQQAILKTLVEEYTEHGAPVASEAFARKRGFHLSPATIRNELAVLEHAGYIMKPHTSAGRVPTDAGYRLYVNNVRGRATPPPEKERQIARVIQTSQDDAHVFARSLAKALADVSAEVAFVSIAGEELSYAGIAHLFEKPEFWSQDRALMVSRLFDEFESLMPALVAECLPEPRALIGRENPLFAECGVVMARYEAGAWEGVLGIVGPLRMRYVENMQLLDTTKKLLNTYGRPTTTSKRHTTRGRNGRHTRACS